VLLTIVIASSSANVPGDGGAVTWRATDDLPETPRPSSSPVAPAPEPADSAATAAPMPDVRTIQAPDGSELFLTWNAPHGQPRASTERRHACGRGQRDTLYLSFRPGRPSDTFIAFMGTLQFRAALGDTLGTWWHFGGKGEHEEGLRCQYEIPPVEGHWQPWRVTGLMWQEYTWRPEVGTLKLLYAVPDTKTAPVSDDSVYVLGRVMLEDDATLEGCRQPVCIEWREATLSYSSRREPIITQGLRFVSWNSPAGAVCAPFQQAGRTRAWRPGTR
jgi:hypothetical protein